MATMVVFHHGRVVSQTADEDCAVPEAAVLIHADGSGLVIMEQEGRHICLNRASLREVIRALQAVAKDAEEVDRG